jgi:hypothetical protein
MEFLAERDLARRKSDKNIWGGTVARASGPGRRGHGGKAWKRGITTGGLIAAAGACVRGLGERSFGHLVSHDIDVMLGHVDGGERVVVTEKMIEYLPPPVQRYLAYTGVVGKPIPRTVYLAQSGRMRFGPGLPWAPLRAHQFYSTQPPAFVWAGSIQAGPVAIARACDKYVGGKGKMLVKAASAFTVVDAGGDEVDQAAMVRYLSEMVWFPSALLLANVSFARVDDGCAQVTFTDHGRCVTGALSVDSAGRLKNFLAQRYLMTGGRFELATWSTPVHEYGTRAGLRVPVRGRAVWGLRGGDFEYIDVWVDELSYDGDIPAGSRGWKPR